MKISISFVLVALLTSVSAQKGILPFSGLVYEHKGISAKAIEVDLDEVTWTSNRLPVNTDFEIRVVNPSGFTSVDGIYYPGIEVAMTNLAGDTLGYLPNLLASEEFTGYEEFTLKKLSVTLGFNELSQTGDSILIYARFFDTNSDNELITRMLVVIADSELPLETTYSTFGIGGDLGYNGIASGIELSRARTEKRAATPTTPVYQHLDLDSLVGLNDSIFNFGYFQATLYDENLEPTVLANNGFEIAMNTPTEFDRLIGLNIDFPIAPETRFCRFRWESRDRSKVLDVITAVNAD